MYYVARDHYKQVAMSLIPVRSTEEVLVSEDLILLHTTTTATEYSVLQSKLLLLRITSTLPSSCLLFNTSIAQGIQREWIEEQINDFFHLC